MKLTRIFSLTLLLAASLFSFPVFAVNFNVVMNGGQEVPPNASGASGNCTAVLSQNQASLSINCTHDATNVVAGHIHLGAAGMNGPFVFPFPTPTSPISETWSPVTNAQCGGSCVEELLAGNLYVNIHSTTYPGGEIRGQLVPQPVTPIPALTTYGLVLLTLVLAAMGALLSRRLS